MLFCARCDGQIDAWDLTDSSFAPVMVLQGAPTSITSMSFLPTYPNQKQQLLATGDNQGNLHLFEVPRTLARGHPNETAMMPHMPSVPDGTPSRIAMSSAIAWAMARAAASA